MIKVLSIGDVFGRPGRKLCKTLIPELRSKHKADLVIVNAENASGGKGLSEKNYKEIMESGIDLITLGDHMFDQKSIKTIMENKRNPIIRPVNYPSSEMAGQGIWTTSLNSVEINVICLQGRIFMREGADNPFRAFDEIHDKLNSDSINLVEFHAEATSEKHAMFWYLDGRASAAWGTHTHVATADERVYPQGLGAIADLGMTGPVDSVIGVDCESSIKRFTSGVYSRFKVSESERVALNGALFEIDEKTKECISVTRIREESVV
jgi:metallophosphoesterase (TIGR00282 family)